MSNLRGSDTIPLVKVSPDNSSSDCGDVGHGDDKGAGGDHHDDKVYEGDGLQNQAPDI